MAYHHCGEITQKDFERSAQYHGTTVHTYLSDGDRGHKVWAFYTKTDDGEIARKYVCDGIAFGYYQYR